MPTRYSCRSGVCHTCLTPVIEGTTCYREPPLEAPPTAPYSCASPHPRAVSFWISDARVNRHYRERVQRRRLDPAAGPLLAEDDGALLRARGIPYAHAARFAAPKPAAPWSDIRDATMRGPVCPQLPSRLDFVAGPW